MKPKLLVILGPTASGKSELAVEIARQFNGEIISADSRQVYKGMNIGTGKITKSEMKSVPHYLLDVVSPKKVFTVQNFKDLAEAAIADILSRGKLPILCGGTGFYIDAVTKGIILPEVPPDLKLRKELSKKTLEELVKTLSKLDRTRLQTIDQQNFGRLIRAIEIAQSLGKVPKVKEVHAYEVLKIGIQTEDAELQKRIRTRLLARIKKGMINEAKKLHEDGLSYKRMHDLGLEYRYLSMFLQNKISKSEMIEVLNTKIWQYAKSQRRWFKRDTEIRWFELEDKKDIYKEIESFI